MKKFILIFSTIFASLSGFNQNTYNFVIEKVYNDNISNTSISYFDGLGRPIQSIQVAASPNGNDMVQHIDYDNLGRESKKYLPYVSTYAGGFYRTNAESEQDAFYKSEFKSSETVNPWATIEFEESPLNRVLQQGAPGTAWQPVKGSDADNSVHFAYETNNSEISRFEINTDNSLTKVDNYASATLYKNGSRNENGVWNYEYKNMLGQVVLKVSDPDSLNLRTCYVYDDFGLLRYVIPPKAVELIGTSGITQDIIDNLCYYYQYDGRKRMIIKKLPGAEDVYMVYDQRDRLVLTQDGNLRTNADNTPRNEWMFTKYDQLDRPIMTGIYQHETLIDQKSMQAILENQMVETEDFYEIYNGDIDGRDFFGYTMDHSFPVSLNNEILTVTYYDNYDFDTDNTIRTYSETFNTDDYPVNKINDRVIGQVTGTRVKVLNEDKYLLSVNYYDNEYRVIRTYAENYLGGDDLLLSKYDFIGNVKKTKQVHFKDGVTTTPVTINQRFEYDHANRLLQVYHQIGENTTDEILLAEMEYNELGQMVKKKLHESAPDNFLQEVDFDYNIRGWLTKINDPANLGNDLFAMQLAYNDVVNGLTETANAQFNGNISAMVWKNNDEFDTDTTHGYAFVYDAINRIIQGNHEYYTNTWTPSTNDYDLQSVSYDANGNIKALSRFGDTGKHIDNLAYEYAGTNQLQYVSDVATNKAEGFVDGINTGNDYAYDNNGNLTHDNNKGIVNIKYNYLNLPEEVDFGSGNKITYIYTAGGVKVAKETYKIDILDMNVVYAGNIIYEDLSGSDFTILTSEGKVSKTSSNYTYEYYLKDHLGNTRVMFHDAGSGNLIADQTNNYYPFGMLFAKENIDKNKFLYNGKELQEDVFNGVALDWYDFGARFYDPAIGRWHVADPKAELAYNQTTYHYVSNNPILRIDPNGETDYTINKETGETKKVENKHVNDKQDRVLKTDKEGNVKKKGEGFLGFMVRDSKKGEEKVAFGGIEKGILSDGMNFKTDDNIVQVGGENQPKIENVENFLVELSDYVGVEIAAASLSGEGQTDASAVYIDEYDGNTDTRANISIQTRYIGDAKFNTNYHSHLSRFAPDDKYVPSPQDISYKAGQSKYFKRFIILSDHPNGPIKY